MADLTQRECDVIAWKLNTRPSQGVAVSGNVAYVVDGGTNVLQLFDVSDPNEIVPLEAMVLDPNLADVAASGNFAYVVDFYMGLLRAFESKLQVTVTSDLLVMGDVTASGQMNALAFNTTSDASAKQNVVVVDTAAVLDRLSVLPISEWSFKSDPTGSRHIGPTAQDFKAAFGIGRDDKHIATVDADGVALVAIQALREEKDRELKAERRELKKLREETNREVAEPRAAIERLERVLQYAGYTGAGGEGRQLSNRAFRD